MRTEIAMAISDGVIGCLVSVCGMIGLFMAAGAVDDGIYVFGLSVFGFACCFLMGQIRRHYDTVDAMQVER
jgi:hypothetical protein